MKELENLIDRYKQRLNNINQLVYTNDGSINSEKRKERILTKQSEYKEIIAELQKLKISNILAVEYGYIHCEKGHNLQRTLKSYQQIVDN